MSKAIHVHVADSLDTIGERVVDGWRRAERGELTGENAETDIGFESWETLVRTLSPKRLELLRHLHRAPARSIRAPAQALGRDYRRVHEDVEALEAPAFSIGIKTACAPTTTPSTCRCGLRFNSVSCFRTRAALISLTKKGFARVYYTHNAERRPYSRVGKGWTLKRVRGSHHVFTHPRRPGIVVVPHPKHELGVGLVAAIRKQAGL